MLKLLKGEKAPVYGDGLNVRDWIQVMDHAAALDLLLRKGIAGGVYNIGVDNERNNLEVTKLILKCLDLGEDRIEYVTDRPGHDRRYAIDASKIRAQIQATYDAGLTSWMMWDPSNKYTRDGYLDF